MARCPVCNGAIEYLVATERDAHVLACVERAASVEQEAAACAVCGKSLAHMTLPRRAQHADRCGARLDQAHGGSLASAVFYCVTCGADLCERDEAYRTRHVKQCAAERNVSAKDMRTLVAERAAANNADSAVPNAFAELVSSHAPRGRSSAALNTLERNLKAPRAALPPAKRRRERSPLTLEEEDLQLARAISLSEATAAAASSATTAVTSAATTTATTAAAPKTPPRSSPARVSTPTLPASRFAARKRPMFALNSQPHTQGDALNRICVSAGVLAGGAPSSPLATLSQLVATAMQSPPPNESLRCSPLDHRPPLDAAAVADVESMEPARAALLLEYDRRIGERRQQMRDKCAQLQEQVRQLTAAMQSEQLDCLRDISALQSERDEQLARECATSPL